jgi:hypothetical protein
MLKNVKHSSRSDFPDSDSFVYAGRRHQSLTAIHVDSVYPMVVSERSDFSSSLDIPDLNGHVPTATDKSLAARDEIETRNRADVTCLDE